MAAEIPIITNPGELTESVLRIRGDRDPAAVMCELGGGILRFAVAVFPAVAPDKIYAQYNHREPEGRGPHFDVYGAFLDEDYPWLGLYNLAGRVSLRTVSLPEDLSKVYAEMYPAPTDEAFDARRHFSAIALGDSKAKIATGTLDAGTGLVLPQKITGPHIVHDLVPENPDHPGKYVKLIAPNGSPEANERMNRGGYKPLDELLSEGLGLALEKGHVDEFADDTDEPLGLQRPGRRPRGRFIRTARLPMLDDDDLYEPPRRHCNLD